MIRGTKVKLSNGEDVGCVLITSVTRELGKICMVMWMSSLRYSWEVEKDLIVCK